MQFIPQIVENYLEAPPKGTKHNGGFVTRRTSNMLLWYLQTPCRGSQEAQQPLVQPLVGGPLAPHSPFERQWCTANMKGYIAHRRACGFGIPRSTAVFALSPAPQLRSWIRLLLFDPQRTVTFVGLEPVRAPILLFAPDVDVLLRSMLGVSVRMLGILAIRVAIELRAFGALGR